MHAGRVFLAVRDAEAKILENTSVADLVAGKGKKVGAAKSGTFAAKKKTPVP